MTRFAFPSRQAVEREIESAENPRGMRLNDGMERTKLPGGTLRYMLAVIDRLNAEKEAAYAAGQRAGRNAGLDEAYDLMFDIKGSKETRFDAQTAIRNRKEQG